MSTFADTRGESADVIVLELPDVGYRIDNWVSYSANASYLSPTDAFSFELAGGSVAPAVRAALKAGARFRCTVNGYVQADGYITRVTSSASRGGGWSIHVSGLDVLAPVVAASCDPTLRFNAQDTLLDLLYVLFSPFGFKTFSDDPNAARNARTGATRGSKLSKKGKPLKSVKLHETKPLNSEGVFQFGSREAQRFGLWIQPSTTPSELVVGVPDFDQAPLYALRRSLDPNKVTNIESGDVTEDNAHQPSCIVASGFSYGGEFDNARMRVICVNELVSLDGFGNPTANVQTIIDKNSTPGTTYLAPRAEFASSIFRPHLYPVPAYLHDQDSKTLEQLEHFARREMALRQHAQLVASYTVQGHSMNGHVWAVDTIVDVDDEIAGLHEPMWCASRTFERSRHAGTVTHLELVRPHTLVI